VTAPWRRSPIGRASTLTGIRPTRPLQRLPIGRNAFPAGSDPACPPKERLYGPAIHRRDLDRIIEGQPMPFPL